MNLVIASKPNYSFRERSAGGQAVESTPSLAGGANRPPPERSGPVKALIWSFIIERPAAGLNGQGVQRYV